MLGQETNQKKKKKMTWQKGDHTVFRYLILQLRKEDIFVRERHYLLCSEPGMCQKAECLLIGAEKNSLPALCVCS